MLPSVVLLDGRSGDYSGFLHLLDDEERDRHDRMQAPGRRGEFVLGRALAKVGTAAIEGRVPASVVILANDDGSPRFDGSDLFLSISHSHGWVAVAIGSEPLGLDIQTVIEELPARVLKPDESAWVRGLPESERAGALTWLWTIKEARGKLAGTGLRFPLPGVRVPLQERDDDGSVKWRLFGNTEVKGAVAMGLSAVLPSTVERLSLPDLTARLAKLGS